MDTYRKIVVIVQEGEQELWGTISILLDTYPLSFVTLDVLEMYLNRYQGDFINGMVLVSSRINSFLLKSQLAFLSNRGIPFIVISEEHSFTIEHKAKMLGCTNYLFPEEPEAIQAAVKALWEKDE